MIYDSLEDNIDGIRNFYWKDALWLSKWQIHCFPTENQEQEIIKIAFKLQQIRDYFGLPINITSWLRPKPYNTLIGGSQDSAHIYGMAIDFVVEGLSADDVRSNLLSRLDDFKIRMEDKPGSSWCHIDHKEAIKGKRFFKP